MGSLWLGWQRDAIGQRNNRSQALVEAFTLAELGQSFQLAGRFGECAESQRASGARQPMSQPGEPIEIVAVARILHLHQLLTELQHETCDNLVQLWTQHWQG